MNVPMKVIFYNHIFCALVDMKHIFKWSKSVQVFVFWRERFGHLTATNVNKCKKLNQ